MFCDAGRKMTALRKTDEVELERVLHAPPPPRSIAKTGLDAGFLVDLMVKTVYRMGLERPSEISHEMKLPAGIIGKLIEAAQPAKLLETLGQLGASMTAEMRYALTGKGREWALVCGFPVPDGRVQAILYGTTSRQFGSIFSAFSTGGTDR